MGMAYITFKGVNKGPIVSFFPTQALASTAASESSDVAHIGELDVGDLNPNGAYFDGTEVLEEIPITALSDLARKKHALRVAHGYLKQLADELTVEGSAHAITEVHAAHNFPAFCHHGLYLVAHDDDYTDAQVIAFAEKIPDGPSDASTPFEWYKEVSALNPLEGPDGPCAWVGPSDASQKTVSETKTGRETIVGTGTVTDTQLSDGAWIEDLT